MYDVARHALFLLPPETAHHVALKSLQVCHRLGLSAALAPRVTHCPVELMGLRFANPVGLAAGLDKNGDYIDALGALGFGFIEIGTVTPRPQAGNPRPRLFRLPRCHAIINRMGFNNLGVDHLVERARRRRYSGVLGINIGKNLTTPVSDAVDDYLICMKKVYTVADYIAVNVSSPNTPGLRDLQGEEQFAALARTLKTEQLRLAEQHGRYTPLVFKIAPDQAQDAIRAQAELLLELKVDGVIATNTTVSRDDVRGHARAEEAGGLSGEPLAARATAVVAALSAASGGALPIIGVGGISDKASASEKIDAGANLVQIYTGFIYRGPSLIAEAVAGCAETFSRP